MLDLEQSTYFFFFFFFALCSVRWDPVDWKHCPRYWWPCLWCMYCFMIIPKSSFFLTQKKKKHFSSEQYALSLLVSMFKDKLISCFRQAGWNSYYINKPKEWGFSIPNQTVTLASQNQSESSSVSSQQFKIFVVLCRKWQRRVFQTVLQQKQKQKPGTFLIWKTFVSVFERFLKWRFNYTKLSCRYLSSDASWNEWSKIGWNCMSINSWRPNREALYRSILYAECSGM